MTTETEQTTEKPCRKCGASTGHPLGVCVLCQPNWPNEATDDERGISEWSREELIATALRLERENADLRKDRDEWKQKYYDGLVRPDELVERCDQIQSQFLAMDSHNAELQTKNADLVATLSALVAEQQCAVLPIGERCSRVRCATCDARAVLATIQKGPQ